MDYEQQMNVSNAIGTAMLSAMAKMCNTPEGAKWPDAVAVYGAVFCLIEIALQTEADLQWVLDLVKDTYESASYEQNLYSRLKS